MALKFTKIRNVKSPCRAHSTDAGIDFFVPEDFPETYLEAGKSILINGGIKVKIPEGHALIFFNRSGVAAKQELILGSCVVDFGYEGELIYNLHNIGTNTRIISPGAKIVQGIILPINLTDVEEVETESELFSESNSERKSGGFGSTGN